MKLRLGSRPARIAALGKRHSLTTGEPEQKFLSWIGNKPEAHMSDVTRRVALSAMAAGLTAAGTGAIAAPVSGSAIVPPAPAFRGGHQPKPLPFKPGSLNG